MDDTWISLARQMLAPELLCDNSLCRAKAGKHMKPLLFGKNDLINAKAYIDAGPAALAITLQKLQAALYPEQPIMLPEDPEQQQQALAIKLSDLRALIASKMFPKIESEAQG